MKKQRKFPIHLDEHWFNYQMKKYSKINNQNTRCLHSSLSGDTSTQRRAKKGCYEIKLSKPLLVEHVLPPVPPAGGCCELLKAGLGGLLGRIQNYAFWMK